MRKFQVLMALGLLLTAVGGICLLVSFLSSSDTAEFTIPSGEYYYRFESVNLIGGEVRGSFEVEFGAPLRMFIFTEQQFRDYSTIGYTDYLFTTEGLSGSFEAKLNSTGKMYIVFEHASSMVATKVRITYNIDGIAVSYLMAGIAMLVVGVVVLLVSIWVRRNEVMTPPPSLTNTDVMMFDDDGPRR